MSQNALTDQPEQIDFTNIGLEDAGEYVCTAANLAGIVTATNVLIVHQTPVVTIVPDSDDLVLTEGDELHLECTATGVPAPRVVWFDNVQSQNPEQFENQLTASHRGHNAQAVLRKNKVRKTDEGYFLCRATNDAGTEDKSVYVTVQDKRGDVGKLTSIQMFLEH